MTPKPTDQEMFTYFKVKKWFEEKRSAECEQRGHRGPIVVKDEFVECEYCELVVMPDSNGQVTWQMT